MKFERLVIENFLTIGRAELALADRGLNVIQGINEDDGSASSNGAGKSSIVDALCWAIYGTTARDLKGDAVVNLTAKKNTRVEVFVSIGETLYRIARHRKHKEHKNALHLHCRPVAEPGVVPTDLTRGTDAETQKEIERIIGCSLEVFMAAVYSGQEAMPDLPRMTDRELKRLIEEAAGLQRIERAYEEARLRRSELMSRLEAATLQRDRLRDRIGRDEAALALKRSEAERFEAEREARVQKALDAARQLAEQRDALIAAVVEAKPDALAAKARQAELQEQIKSIKPLEEALKAAQQAYSRQEVAVATCKHELLAARKAVQDIEQQIANVDAEMSKPCPECGKPHTPEEREQYLEHRRVKLEEAKARLAEVELKARKAVQELNRAKEALNDASAAVPDVSGALEEINTCARTVQKVVDLGHQAKLAEQRLEAAEKEVARVRDEPNPVAAVVKALEERIVQDAAELAASETERENIQAAVAVADAVVKVYGPAGVRAHILDTVTPFLNERTADYLSALSDGAITAVWSTLTKSASGELKEKFSIEVSHAKGGASFAALSGGEKRKVRLATALALQDLVASRATQPISLWLGDEIDDALDPAGLERLMVILERRARERGTVLIISHNDLSDWCDLTTTVRKSGGISTVEGSLCC